MLSRIVVRVCILGLAAFALASAVHADPRPWTFVTDLYPEGKGNIEFEHYTTWETHKKHEKGFDSFQFTEEIELGIAENFDISIYLANWNYEDSRDRKGSRYESSGMDAVYYLTKPSDVIGIGFYFEALLGESAHEYSVEAKLLLQKDIGKWSFAYNLVAETVVSREGGDDNVEGALEHAFGVSYAFNKNWRIGGELTIESVFTEWSHYEETSVYAGPNISYIGNGIPGTSKSNWWITATPAFQLTNLDDEPDFVLRVIVGIDF